MTANRDSASLLRRAIIVCALGYFIDIFDLQLFTVLRVPSLTELGVASGDLATIGGYILDAQMIGMIVGAFVWGWFGDRHGRLKALYGSIIVYSIGTLACSLVHDPLTYGLLRFFTGLGLAGETGAAVTLIAETMRPEKRGWGVTLIGGIGFMGPVFSILLAWFVSWRETYVIAGILGFVLLALRMRLAEPALFEKSRRKETLRGSWKLLMKPKRIAVFVSCLVLMFPMGYVWFVLNFFSMEFSQGMLRPGEVFDQKICLLLFFAGTSLGDFLSGMLSQIWHSRRKAISAFLGSGAVVTIGYLLFGPHFKYTAPEFYFIHFLIGTTAGCIILAFLNAAEQFGTNIRATTTITITNINRGITTFMIFALQGLRHFLSIADAALIIAVAVYIVAFLALRRLREMHGVDLDYAEKLG